MQVDGDVFLDCSHSNLMNDLGLKFATAKRVERQITKLNEVVRGLDDVIFMK